MADLAVIEQPTIKVAIVYNPFKANEIETHELVHNPDFSLADYLGSLPDTCEYVVGHNGDSYERETWSTLKFEPGDAFSLICVPEGGGGGGKNIFRMVALIAVVAAAALISSGALLPGLSSALGGALGVSAAGGQALLGAFVGIAGSMLVNAIMPAPSPTASKSVTSAATYGYDGPKNTSQEGIPVPVVYGTYRVAGNIVDAYTKAVGDDQYLFLRTIINDGKVNSITNFEINDEDIANFSNVETRVALGEDDGTSNDWFGESVRQVNKGMKLSQDWVTHTTTGPVDKLRLAILCPSGLSTQNSDGAVANASVELLVEYKPHESPDSAYSPLTSQTPRTFSTFSGGNSALPGYGKAPNTSTLTGYTHIYGGLVNQVANTLEPDAAFAGAAPSVIGAYSPMTNESEYVLKYDVPAASASITVEGLAELLVVSDNDLGAAYKMQAVYREAGTNPWLVFGEETGAVSQITGSDPWPSFPMVYRRWTCALDPSKTYEVAILGGTPTDVTVSSNDGGSGSVTITRASTSAVRYDYESGTLANAVYDVRVRRTTVEGSPTAKPAVIDTTYLNDISEILIDNLQYPGTANVSLKIKMNDQLSSIPKFTALVEGSLVKQFDADGTVVTEGFSAWPSWALADVLMNENRGRGLSASRIDFSAFKEWEAYCIEKNLKLNIVFDQDSNVWDTAQTICRVGHAALVRVGTRWSVIVDKPADAVMPFNDSNIIKGTFQTDWLPLADRANEIQYSFYDADQKYVQQTLRITDPLAPNTGAGLRIAAVTQLGVTDIDQAKFDVEKQIRQNRLLLKTVSFEAPLEAIGLTQGDVALIQHTSSNYSRNIGTGRLKPGSTDTSLNLDNPVTLLEGVTYKALVQHPAIKRYDVTITSVTDAIYVTGLPSEMERCTRLIQGDNDVGIYNVFGGSPSDRIEVDNTSGFVTGPASLWATDVMEEATVSSEPGTYTSVALAAPLLAAPADYSVWMVGPVETVKQPFRLKTIEGSSILRRKLTFTEYNDLIYSPLGTVVTRANPPVRGPVTHAAGLHFSYNRVFTGDTRPVNVTFSWLPGDAANYGGADVYSRTNGGIWTYLRTLPDVSTYDLPLKDGDDFQFKVVEFDLTGARANADTAPVVGGTVKLYASDLVPPTDLLLSLKDFLVTATVKAVWTATTSPVIDGYRTQYINVSQATYLEALAGTWSVPVDSAWNDCGVSKVTNSIIQQSGVGYVVVRVRAEYGRSVSDWLVHAFQVEAPALPDRVTGLALNNGTADVNSDVFTGKDAKFSWRDVATEAAALAADGADTTGMDYNWNDYQVVIKTPEGAVVRTETSRDPFYVYSYEKNVDDTLPVFGAGRARRAFTIEVRLRGKQGQLSDPAVMSVSNAAPGVVEGTLVPSIDSIQLQLPRPTDLDYAGVIVYASDTTGFTPGPTNQVWIGPGTPTWYCNSQTTYYVRWAVYDSFGTDSLNLHGEASTTTTGITSALLTPAVIEALSVSADLLTKIGLIDAADTVPGSVSQRVAAEATARLNAISDEAAARASAITAEAAARSDAIAAAEGTLGDQITFVSNTQTTRTDDLQSQINLLSAASGDGYAGLVEESNQRVSADGALSTRIDAVVATSNSNTSAISSEASARASADGALSTRIDSVVATANGAVASITAEQTARANAINTVTTSINTQASRIDSANSAITSEATTRANADGALSTRIDAVVATANGAVASITSEATTRANADGALSTRIDAVVATANGAAAAVASEATTRANADGALSTRIDTVTASANANASSITSEATARANADGALSTRIDAVVATANSNSAAISSEASTRASQDSALASSINTVSTTVAGHTATISSYGSSINGLLARAGVTTNVNGHITGWALNNNGTSGSFIIQADYFAISDAAGNVSTPFYVSGGVTYISNAHILNLTAGNVQAGSLTTGTLANNAVTGLAAATASGNASLGFSCSGAPVVVWAKVSASFYPVSQGYVYLYRNGSQIDVSGATVSSAGFLLVVDYPGAGNHTYSVGSANYNGGDGSTTSSTIVAAEFKK